MLEWLIIGGGVHGTHLSNVIVGALGVDRDAVRVLDPFDQPLHAWRRRAHHCAMDFLRSPGVHHIALDPFGLLRFARSGLAPAPAEMWGLYKHPSLELFDAHAKWTVERERLAELRIRGRMDVFEREGAGYRIQSSAGEFRARRLLLAIGPPEGEHWPTWGRALAEEGAPVRHALGASDPLADLHPSAEVLVVGSGCTAAHLTLRLARRATGSVTWLSTLAPRTAEYDASPGWLGPRLLAGFAATSDASKRRAAVAAARRPGTIPERLHHALKGALHRRRLQSWVGEIGRAQLAEGGVVVERSDARTTPQRFDRIVFATGFARLRPGDSWLTEAATRNDLPLSPCGYPLLSSALEWGPNLFVSGQLAELELGPNARNIVGARLAAERLALARSVA